ncbi:MAG: hypothetical protein JO132_08815 [Streptosporangiaceae bacterium]|nr:hypothetical protein [Streptosporangiaceae bacterium]
MRLPVLADPGYEGAGCGVHTPVKKPAGVKELDIGTAPATPRSARREPSVNAASPC